MGNILNPEDRKLIYCRIAKLTPESQAMWGKMNVNQMLRHLSDAIRMQLGELDVKDAGNFFTHTLLKWATIAGAPPPKNATTFPEINEVLNSVNPQDFTKEKETLNELFQKCIELNKHFYHPLFGTVSPNQLGKINYTHMNHHLKQFSV